jgi:hypothetical protein
VLLSHREPSVDLWERGADNAWSRTTFGPGEIAVVHTLSARLAVDEIYAFALTRCSG